MFDTALLIVREEGADRLTLGHLAKRASVSKPVACDHFDTRSGLLIELYRWIDNERVDAFRDMMVASAQGLDETVAQLAKAYIDCAADLTDEFQVMGAALAGSEEKAAIFQELLAKSVFMVVSLRGPHAPACGIQLERLCVGLVGAGEALSAAVVCDELARAECVGTRAALTRGGVLSPD